MLNLWIVCVCDRKRLWVTRWLLDAYRAEVHKNVCSYTVSLLHLSAFMMFCSILLSQDIVRRKRQLSFGAYAELSEGTTIGLQSWSASTRIGMDDCWQTISRSVLIAAKSLAMNVTSLCIRRTSVRRFVTSAVFGRIDVLRRCRSFDRCIMERNSGWSRWKNWW